MFQSPGSQASIVSSVNLPEFAIEVHGLKKTYASPKSGGGNRPMPKEALKGIDLKVPRGSVFGLLGPNGAGKSTLINILAGLTLKNAGLVKIWDFDIETNRRRASAAIGIVPQELNLDAFFTPRALLELQAGLYGVPKNERITDQLLAAVDLTDKADSYARTLSGGMRRRLMVAKAMVHAPPVLVLDEPTAGVDVELRRSLWAYVKKLNETGTTIILTTHYLEEAEELCDQIAIINHGQVIANETKNKLLSRLDNKQILLTLKNDLQDLPQKLALAGWQKLGTRQIQITYKPSETNFGQLLQNVQESNLEIEELSTKEADLEDVFVQLTKNTLNE